MSGRLRQLRWRLVGAGKVSILYNKLTPAAAAAFVVLVVAAASGGQRTVYTLGADEITVSSGPYEPRLVFASHADEVQVDVRVLDGAGGAVAGLKRRDFKLFDNGRPQVISGFSAVEGRAVGGEANKGRTGAATRPGGACAPLSAPRHVLLYFDDLATGANDLAWSREKALAFFGSFECGGELPAGESVGVVTGSGFGDSPFTTHEATLRQALLGVAPHPRSSSTALCPLITPYQAWEIIHLPPGNDAGRLARMQAARCGTCSRDCDTVVRDRAEEVWGEAEIQTEDTLARLQNAVATLAHQAGQRTLVLTSSGFLAQQSDLQRGQQALIEEALRAHVVIDAIDASGLVAPAIPAGGLWNDPYISAQINAWRTSEDAGGFSPRDAAMWEIAASTGGDFLHDNNDLRSAYQRDIAGPAVYYELTFARPDLSPDGSFHGLKVAVSAPGNFRVEARHGYFAPTPETAPASLDLQGKLISEVLGRDAQSRIDAELHLSRWSGGVRARVQVNPLTLTWKRSEGRHLDHLTLVFALLTPAGAYVAGAKAEVSLRLRGGSLKALSRPGVGLSASASLAAAPGAYRLRLVGLEPSTGAMVAMAALINIAPR